MTALICKPCEDGDCEHCIVSEQGWFCECNHPDWLAAVREKAGE